MTAPVAARQGRERTPSSRPAGTMLAALRGPMREPMTYLASAVASLAATVYALRLWEADLRVPFGYSGDAVAVGAHVKTVLETGWYESQPLLGFPAGQTYHDFPTADNLNFVFARLLGLFTSDWATAMNLYYVLGFPLAALAATWFLREVRVTRAAAVALATLFAIAPYHFLRGVSHLWLASYFTVPLALVVVLRAIRGEPLWGMGAGPRALRAFTGRGASTVLCLALVATASSYYAVFSLVLLAVAGIAAWLRTQHHRRLLGVVVAGSVVVLTVLANMAPDVLYARANGDSAAGFVRGRAEVEVYALKLSQLLLPVPGHRVGPLAEIRAKYDATYPLMSEQPVLGVVAAAGLVAAFVLIGYGLAVRTGRVPAGSVPDEQAARTQTLSGLSLLILVAFLSSTVGGLATFVSFVTASLRGWNRMSIVIALLCLAVVGLIIDAWVARSAVRRSMPPRRRTAVAWILAGTVLLVGTFDQVTPGAAPDHDGLAARYAADERWITTVEEALPAEAAVFQLPHAGFPETPPVNGVYDTDYLVPYLHSATLRWSAGGIKGRPTTDWPFAVATLPADEMADALALVGFSGVMVDRVAYGPQAAAELEGALTAAVGSPLAASDDGRYLLYGLAGRASDLAAANPPDALTAWRDSILAPVTAYAGAEASSVNTPDGAPAVALSETASSVVLVNDRPAAVRVRLTARTAGAVHTVAAEEQQAVPVQLSVGGQVIDLPSVGGVLDVVLDAAPGTTTAITVVTGGPVVLRDLQVRDLGLPSLDR